MHERRVNSSLTTNYTLGNITEDARFKVNRQTAAGRQTDRQVMFQL